MLSRLKATPITMFVSVYYLNSVTNTYVLFPHNTHAHIQVFNSLFSRIFLCRFLHPFISFCARNRICSVLRLNYVVSSCSNATATKSTASASGQHAAPQVRHKICRLHFIIFSFVIFPTFLFICLSVASIHSEA